jgi:DNA-binding NtrC family response regulator
MSLFRRRDEPLRLLALTPEPEEWQALQRIADAEGWSMFWARTCGGARQLIERHSIPIVICDRNLPGGDWRTIVSDLATLVPLVCVLLASDVADDYLWREVVQNRGFELLTKPFDPDKVVRMVRFAWSWRGWTQASYAARNHPGL